MICIDQLDQSFSPPGTAPDARDGGHVALVGGCLHGAVGRSFTWWFSVFFFFVFQIWEPQRAVDFFSFFFVGFFGWIFQFEKRSISTSPWPSAAMPSWAMWPRADTCIRSADDSNGYLFFPIPVYGKKVYEPFFRN